MESPFKVVHQCSVWLELTQTWLYNLVRYLPAHIENHVVCRRAQNLDHFPFGQVHALKRDAPLTYLAQRFATVIGRKQAQPFLARHLAMLRPAILHSHFGNNGWKVMRTAERFDLCHFVSFYGQDVSRLPKQNPAWVRRYRELFKSTQTRFLCEGSFMAQSLVDLGCERDRIQVHHLGVEVEKISYRPRQWQAGEPLRVLLAASFREKKGLPYALEALARLRSHVPLTITIIGDAGKASAAQQEKQKILDTIERHRLGDVTRLLGYQSQKVLWEEAYQHHLFLSPSVTAADGDAEGGAPVALIDMAASGMPVVSSFHCDIPEVIRHGETGWLAPERDIDAIVGAIEQWLDQPQQWASMLQAGRHHIEQHYDARTQGALLARHYSDAMGKR